MPRGENLRGKPGPGRKKGVPNKVTLEVREAARRLVEDPAYVANLGKRLIDGTAGQMEVVCWHYAFGRPPRRSLIEDDHDEARFAAQRADILDRMHKDPAGVVVLDALIRGCSLREALHLAGVTPPESFLTAASERADPRP
jgi:hypothetical protein